MPRPNTVTRLLACAALTTGLSACSGDPLGPAPPLMSPYPAAGYDYGYAEERLTAELWRVVYHGPWRRLDLDAPLRQRQLDRAASEAADLALWRAAQLALLAGKPAFSIADRRTDTETLRRPGAFVDDPWPYYGSYTYGRRAFGPQPWPASYYVPGEAHGRARATLVIRLENRATAAALDAAAAVRRLEPIYAPAKP
jgi:hypothetical protein